MTALEKILDEIKTGNCVSARRCHIAFMDDYLPFCPYRVYDNGFKCPYLGKPLPFNVYECNNILRSVVKLDIYQHLIRDTK